MTSSWRQDLVGGPHDNHTSAQASHFDHDFDSIFGAKVHFSLESPINLGGAFRDATEQIDWTLFT